MSGKNRFLLVLLAVLVLLIQRYWPHTDASFNDVPAAVEPSAAPVYEEKFISFNETSAVHAPTIVERADGRLLAAWYGGSREGAQDVAIHGTIIDVEKRHLSPVFTLVERQQTQQDSWRYVRKLGNPVMATLPDGRLMLVYVGVSFGGWAASRLYVRFSADGGLNWTPAKQIVTSPFLNISTLVKGRPIVMENGWVGLPVYHEFFGKFSEFLLLDGDARVRGKHRISWGRDAIQPVVVAQGKQQAMVFMRDSSEETRQVKWATSKNGGKDWSRPELLALANPNAAVAAVSDNNGSPLLVINDHEVDRFDLTLASRSAETWRRLHRFEYIKEQKPGEKSEFSYPYLIRDRQGGFHMVYTWMKKRIKYIYFNQAWLDQRMQEGVAW